MVRLLALPARRVLEFSNWVFRVLGFRVLGFGGFKGMRELGLGVLGVLGIRVWGFRGLGN